MLRKISKEELTIMIVIISLAHVFTYYSFKYHTKKTDKHSNVEDALMYPLVNSYVGLYSILLSFTGIWLYKVAALSFGESQDLEWVNELFKSCVRFSFNTMAYSTPIITGLGLMAYLFKTQFILNSKNEYSVTFQVFMCILTLLLFVVSNESEIQIKDESVIKYFIVLITFVALLKTNQSFNENASQIDVLASSFSNVFLNFNWKLLIILLPFVIFAIAGYMTVTDTPLEKMTKYLIVAMSLVVTFVVLAIILAKIEKNKRENESGRKADKGFQTALAPFKEAVYLVINPAVLKSLTKWSVYLVIYSLPLALYVKLTSNNFNLFKQKYMETFNKRFLFMLFSGYGTISIMHNYIKLDADHIEKIMSLVIATSLIISRTTPSSLTN